MNSTITIEDALDHETLKPLLRGAFKSGAVYRVECPLRMALYKLTQAGAASAGGEIAVGPTGFATPWWFSYETLFVTDPRFGAISIRGVADVAENVSRSRVGFRDFLRTRGAVCHDWNLMTHLLIIELTRPVVGMMGICSGQPVYEDEALGRAHGAQNISFIGGEQQFYVPGLRRMDLVVRRFGAVG